MESVRISKIPTKYLGKIVLRTLGAVVLIGLTIQGICPLIEDYIENNNALQMEVMGSNQSIRPSSISLCMPFVPRALHEFTDYLNQNATGDCEFCDELIKTLNFTAIIPINSDELELAYRLFHWLLEIDNDQNQFEILHANNSNWNQPILEAVWIFFQCLTECDKTFWNCICFGKFRGDDLVASREKIDKLYEQLVIALCQHITINQNDSNMILDRPSQVFKDWFCFELPVPKFSLTVVVNSTTTKNVTFSAIGAKGASFYLLQDTALIDGALEHTNSPIRVSKISYDDDSYSSSETVYLQYHVQSTIVGKRKIDCYNESTPAECETNCAIRKSIDNLGCLPFTARMNAAAAEFKYYPGYCSTINYGNKSRRSLLRDDISCSLERCKYPCEYVSYKWEQNIFRDATSKTTARVFRLNVSPVRYPYMEFKITQRLSCEQLVAAIGGVFGFYLGFSGWTIVCALIKSLEIWGKWSKKKSILSTTDMPENIYKRDDKMESIVEIMKQIRSELSSMRSEVESRVRDIEKHMDILQKNNSNER